MAERLGKQKMAKAGCPNGRTIASSILALVNKTYLTKWPPTPFLINVYRVIVLKIF
jgi:hypothetical protein